MAKSVNMMRSARRAALPIPFLGSQWYFPTDPHADLFFYATRYLRRYGSRR